MGCVFLFAVEILVSDIMESLCVIIRKEEQISVLVKTDKKELKLGNLNISHLCEKEIG